MRLVVLWAGVRMDFISGCRKGEGLQESAGFLAGPKSKMLVLVMTTQSDRGSPSEEGAKAFQLGTQMVRVPPPARFTAVQGVSCETHSFSREASNFSSASTRDASL